MAPKKFVSFKTNILRYCQQIYWFVIINLSSIFLLKISFGSRLIGIQFYPVDLKNWRSVLGLLINITFKVLFVKHHCQPILRFKRFAYIYHLSKPLIVLLMEFYQTHAQPLFNITLLFYYLFYFSQIFSLLDQFHLFYNRKKFQRYFLIWAVAFNLLYIPILSIFLKHHTLNEDRPVYLDVVIKIYHFIGWCVVIYYKYATAVILKETLECLINSVQGLWL